MFVLALLSSHLFLLAPWTIIPALCNVKSTDMPSVFLNVYIVSRASHASSTPNCSFNLAAKLILLHSFSTITITSSFTYSFFAISLPSPPFPLPPSPSYGVLLHLSHLSTIATFFISFALLSQSHVCLILI